MPEGGTARTRVCRSLTLGFSALWAVALLLLLIGTFGLFGQERDPLSGVFLVPLSMPWNLLPVEGTIWAIVAPGINLAVIVGLCRLSATR